MGLISALDWFCGPEDQCAVVRRKEVERKVDSAFVEHQKSIEARKESQIELTQTLAVAQLANMEATEAFQEYKKKVESGEHEKVK
jgi:hypothetical protein